MDWFREDVTYVFLVLLFVYFFHTRRNKYETFFKNFPTPPMELFFGHARSFTSSKAFLQVFHDYTKTYGSMFRLKLGPVRQVLVCSDYNFLQFMLNNVKSFRKTQNMRYLRPWLGDGLTTSEGDRWKNRRKLITPAFHFNVLEKFVDIFESNTDVLISNLSKLENSQSIDIHSYIIRCSLDIICETAMGTQINAQSNKISRYVQGVREMCRIFITRTLSILHRYDFSFRFTQDFQIQEKALKDMHEYVDSIINTKRNELKKSRISDNLLDSSENVSKAKKKVFLDLLLQVGDNDQDFSLKDVRDEVNTFMFAGHDTTAAASSFILFCLANHRNIQDKVFEEQRKIFGDTKNTKVSYSDLQQMRYLDCVIKEGMRIYTPVPFFGRETNEEVNYNGTVIPKGVTFIIFVYGLHLNPNHYPDPEKFDPSRFEDAQVQPCAYLPFSTGPRNCIGQKYAMLEIKSIVAKIVRNFELSPAIPHHDLELAAESVLRSLNGVKIKLKLR